MRFVVVSGLLIAAVSFWSFADLDTPKPETERPVDVFSALDGSWKGVFVGYDEVGKELYRIRVRQVYRTVDDATQKVEIQDIMPDGTVVRGEGKNTATRGSDGSLSLRCVVRKSNGEEVEHDGRVILGPDGNKELIWYSKTSGKVETFREAVRVEGERTVYEIQGMGRYDGSLMLMTGRYYKE